MPRRTDDDHGTSVWLLSVLLVRFIRPQQYIIDHNKRAVCIPIEAWKNITATITSITTEKHGRRSRASRNYGRNVMKFPAAIAYVYHSAWSNEPAWSCWRFVSRSSLGALLKSSRRRSMWTPAEAPNGVIIMFTHQLTAISNLSPSSPVIQALSIYLYTNKKATVYRSMVVVCPLDTPPPSPHPTHRALERKAQVRWMSNTFFPAAGKQQTNKYTHFVDWISTRDYTQVVWLLFTVIHRRRWFCIPANCPHVGFMRDICVVSRIAQVPQSKFKCDFDESLMMMELLGCSCCCCCWLLSVAVVQSKVIWFCWI